MTSIFFIVRFPYLCSNISISPAYGVWSLSWFDTQWHALRKISFYNEVSYWLTSWLNRTINSINWSHHFVSWYNDLVSRYFECWLTFFLKFIVRPLLFTEKLTDLFRFLENVKEQTAGGTKDFRDYVVAVFCKQYFMHYICTISFHAIQKKNRNLQLPFNANANV